SQTFQRLTGPDFHQNLIPDLECGDICGDAISQPRQGAAYIKVGKGYQVGKRYGEGGEEALQPGTVCRRKWQVTSQDHAVTLSLRRGGQVSRHGKNGRASNNVRVAIRPAHGTIRSRNALTWASVRSLHRMTFRHSQFLG